MDGIFIINKEENLTSHDIVYKIKKEFNEKVGHTGTLDPMATGVLPILIGKGTLCSKYLINHDKIYETVIQLGQKTDTADREGKIIEEKNVEESCFNKEYIEEILKTFLGEQEQVPPIYSAIKIKGKKLYEYARKGEKVEIEPRKIKIYDIELLKIDKLKKQIALKVSCSKGTYIRSLCEDIANKLGTVGYMCFLNRLKVGDFDIENSITLKELLEQKSDKNFLGKYLISIEKLFRYNKEIALEEQKIKHFLNGVKLTTKNSDGIYRIYKKENDNKIFLGIGIVENNLLKRDIII